MPITRRVLAAALSLAGICGAFPLRLIGIATAAEAADASNDLSKPTSLPEMVLGASGAPVRIIEYAASTCPHCARFNRDVFPKLKSEFIDTGKVRYVFREFPLNIKDVACAMVARTIANNDSGKYFAVIDVMFRQQDDLVKKTTDTLKRIAHQAGLGDQAVEDCLRDQATLDKIQADQKFAIDTLKIEGTPTFFVNGTMIVGEIEFEELSKRINSLLKT
ncbi:DsbA family protein [Bradyrhizobium jicamae]|uniref:DsbA family protein n=1 Tax=Bradyrhizobium jicamae TaxID=280332 RepID=A0ABS5FFL9_9BRAD|nr:DsbA family protein [Bradyrhizobium jicamae]MBR0795587.1 DsbA family protein [Bradyrhizobium jicamae]MBR0932627.1 DsbA family protein [Bradyrhizobium jicamae]